MTAHFVHPEKSLGAPLVLCGAEQRPLGALRVRVLPSSHNTETSPTSLHDVVLILSGEIIYL